MRTIFLKCPSNKKCPAIQVVCQESDQAITCSNCNRTFLFLNVGKVSCKRCKKEIIFSLTSFNPIAFCENCRTKYSFTVESNPKHAYTPYCIEDDSSVNYCGLDCFEGLEDEVELAKKAFKKVDLFHGGFSFKYNKKALYLNQIEHKNLKFPIKVLRAWHLYCNFKQYPTHNNGKYYGLISGFVDGTIFKDLINNHGLVEIWVKDEKVKDIFTKYKQLNSYAKRVRVI